MIGPDGRMNDEAGELAGLTQDEADERIVEWLREHGQLEKRESYRHTVSLCDRCKSRIEPRISLQWCCSMDELKKPALEALRSRARALPSRVAAPLRDQLPRGGAGLEHLAPDLVGTSASALGVPGRARHRPGGGAGGVQGVRVARADEERGRARHVVLVRAVALRNPRLAGRHRGPADVLSRRSQHDGPRHHPPLGEPHDLQRARDHGRHPVQGRRDPLARARADGWAHVEEPRHGSEPDRADRGLRRGRHALRAHEDGVGAGLHVLGRRDRGGAEARQQALEREPAAASERVGRGRRASLLARGALDPRAALGRPSARSRRISRSSTSRTSSPSSIA